MIAVLGARGQLGSDLVRMLGEDAMPLDRNHANLSEGETLRRTLHAHRPSVIVNCAAYNFVDRAEAEPEAAFAVNAIGVHHLARICRDLDATLVHISSDYVFGQDTLRQSPYGEEEAPGPSCVYGASKLAGEYLARIHPKHFVVRTCGLYGLAGRTSKKGNFVEMILRQIDEGKPLRVVIDQRCTPTASMDLAHSLLELMRTDRFGLYHLTNEGHCSWYEFAQEILRIRGVDRPIEAVTTASFASPARRPTYSVLANHAASHLGIRLRPWREALAEYLAQRRSTP